MNTLYILTVFVALVSVVSSCCTSSKQYNPCKKCRLFNPKDHFEDPQDCSRYYKCHDKCLIHKKCPEGTSFDPNKYSSCKPCTGKHPSMIADCYSNIDINEDDDDDRLGLWSKWSACSATCGQGTKQRQRKCIGRGNCAGLGPLEEKRDCPDLPSCQGTLGEWSQWSGCSATCYDEGEEVEGGRPKVEPTRSRTRECLGGPNVTCEDLGELTEVVACVNCKHCFFGGGTAENDEGDYDCDF